MVSFNYVIKDEIGIHARPAGMLAKEAKAFESKITLAAKGKEADVTRLIQCGSKAGRYRNRCSKRRGRRCSD